MGRDIPRSAEGRQDRGRWIPPRSTHRPKKCVRQYYAPPEDGATEAGRPFETAHLIFGSPSTVSVTTQ